MKRRVVSWLMALVMVLSVLPIQVWAAGSAASASAVYVTISVAGELKTKRLAVGLSDLDGDGNLTVNDALIAAHNAAYSGGATAGYGYYTGTYGLSMSKLWGDTSNAFGYYKNDQSCWSLADTVNAGDHIKAFVYTDKSSWSDVYSYFDAGKKVIAAGGFVSLTLNYYSYDASWSLVSNALSNATVTIDGTAYSTKTDSTGKITIPFNAVGSYVVSASSDSMTIVPPVCVVEVLSEADYNSNYPVIQNAETRLTWASLSEEAQNAVTTTLALPSSLTVNTADGDRNVSVSWASTNSALSVSEYGGFLSAYVDRPASEDATGDLTATLTYTVSADTAVTDTLSFAVTVKAEGVSDTKTGVVSFKKLMDTIASGYASSTDAWTVLDMAGYGKNIKGASYGYSSDVASALAECAIGGSINTWLETLKAFDVNGSYAIYTTPYVLLAYDAAGVKEDSSFICTRAPMKTSMVNYLNALSTNYAGVDEVTPILAALAPYYGKGDSDLNRAVNAAITWLSEQQQSNGTFSYWGTSNANSAAMVVVALSALGIDAHRDSRFIKNGHSALEGLLSFALANCSGFGYKGNVTKNDLATEQGFRALVSYARFAENNGKAYNIYLDANVNTTAAAPADPKVTTTVAPAPVTPDDEDTTITVRLTVRGNAGTWLNTSVSVKKGVSVYDVLTSVLRENGYSWEGTSTYISFITSPGGTRLGEFSTGANSGWLYKVNGRLPSVSVGDYTLSNGDSIVFYYTDDWTKDPAAAQMAGLEENAVTAEEVVKLISAIGTVTLDSGSAINAARLAYNQLSDTEKTKVTNYDVLVAAEAAYAQLLKEEQEQQDAAASDWKTAYTAALNAVAAGELTFGSEWQVIALARSGRSIPAGYYESVVKAVQNAGGVLSDSKYTEYSRTILALTAIGKDPTDVGGYNLLEKLADMDKVTYQGINGTIFALIALDSGNYDVPAAADGAAQTSREALVDYLLAAQLDDGGWALTGSSADTDVTAMALQALAQYRDDSRVKTAVDEALEALSGMQLADGGFGSWGTVNSESCAQVIIALTALGIDPASDSRFLKNGLSAIDALCGYYRDGGFAHTADGTVDAMATEQALCALAAYDRLLNGKSSLYDMTDSGTSAATPAAPEATVTPEETEAPAESSSGTPVAVWIALGAVAVAGGGALVVRRKRS